MLIPVIYSITCILLIGYSILMIYTTIGWRKITSGIPANQPVEVKLSIVVPFRNEAIALPAFLQSIKIQNYNKSAFELIMVDDHSLDKGPEIVNEFIRTNDLTVSLHQLGKGIESKKKAIEKGVKQATGQVIITSDADTLRKENWLHSIAQHFASDEIEMLIAPVCLKGSTFIQRFQTFEFHALQYITLSFAAQNNPVLCNGANLAYRKRFFNRMDGFKSNETISSGDDIFLLFQLKKENKKAITFTPDKDTVVSTEALHGIFELINQKIRWVSKSIHIADISFLLLSLLVTSSNIWLICLLPLEYNLQSWPLLSLVFLTVKCIFDFTMIRRISTIFNIKLGFGIYIISFILYPIYLIGVFILSMVKTPDWKGRRVRL